MRSFVRLLKNGLNSIKQGSREAHARSILKSVSYRVYQSFIVSPIILWFLTGNPSLCLKFGLAEFFIKIPAYYLFERVWCRIEYGYRLPRSIYERLNRVRVQREAINNEVSRGCLERMGLIAMDKGFVVWLTGLPGSGKTTLANGVAGKLREEGYRVEVLDGDWVRKTINVGAGFTKEERRRHLLRVAWVSRLLARNGVIVLCSFVSPYRDVRGEVRRIVEEEVPFYEVWVKCSVEECIRRDPKGLYKKALRGEIQHFTGISDPYEPPENPDLVIDTEHDSLEENVNKLYAFVKEKVQNMLPGNKE